MSIGAVIEIVIFSLATVGLGVAAGWFLHNHTVHAKEMETLRLQHRMRHGADVCNTLERIALQLDSQHQRGATKYVVGRNNGLSTASNLIYGEASRFSQDGTKWQRVKV